MGGRGSKAGGGGGGGGSTEASKEATAAGNAVEKADQEARKADGPAEAAEKRQLAAFAEERSAVEFRNDMRQNEPPNSPTRQRAEAEHQTAVRARKQADEAYFNARDKARSTMAKRDAALARADKIHGKAKDAANAAKGDAVLATNQHRAAVAAFPGPLGAALAKDPLVKRTRARMDKAEAKSDNLRRKENNTRVATNVGVTRNVTRR